MKYAPITLFVYNRPWHTRQTVEALKRNSLACESDLYIYSDGPRRLEQSDSVVEVRKYISDIKGFKSVTVVTRSENRGLAGSIVSGVTEIINNFGRIIVLEDDLVTSPHFLTFMNDALDYYRDDERVVNIHGYMYPVGGTLPETYFLKDTGSWGWATWKRGWDLFEPDGAKLLKELKKRKMTRDFDMDGAYPFTRILKDQIEGINDSWAIRWQASAFLNNRLTLFPGRSLVNNIGHDSSGVHCASSVLFESRIATEPVIISSIPVEESSEALELLKAFFRATGPTSYVRFCMMVRRWLTAITGQSKDSSHKDVMTISARKNS